MRPRRQAALRHNAGSDRLCAKYENGERRLDIIELVTICRAIEADPISLMREIAFEVAQLQSKGPKPRGG
jgi:hypothetical protein